MHNLGGKQDALWSMWKLGTEWANEQLKLVYLNFVSIAQDVRHKRQF